MNLNQTICNILWYASFTAVKWDKTGYKDSNSRLSYVFISGIHYIFLSLHDTYPHLPIFIPTLFHSLPLFYHGKNHQYFFFLEEIQSKNSLSKRNSIIYFLFLKEPLFDTNENIKMMKKIQRWHLLKFM